MMAHFLKVFLLLSAISVCHGFFSWKACVKPLKTPAAKVQSLHGCEDKKDVVLSCSLGYKISILKVFFGHGHGYKSTCDTSFFGQNCGSRAASSKVRFLCQDKDKCVISPTGAVLGSTSCTFMLKSDLLIEYVCHKEILQDAISLESLQVSPSIINLPGNLNASAILLVKRHLPATTKVILDIQAKVLGVWVPIPCVSNYGSCTYDNFCELLRGEMFNECDREMENQGIPCDCPIPTGRFTIPTQAITVTKEQIEQIPVWDSLASGQYWMKADFMDVYDRPLGCIQLQLQIDVNSDKKKRSLRIKAN